MPRNFFIDEISLRIDLRLVAAMRFVLAFSALFIIFIDPTEPDRLVTATYFALVLYTLYSGALYFFVIYDQRIIKPVLDYSHWADILWYLLLISLSSGTNSIFFFFFFFAVLHASFSYGFVTGFNVTIVSALAFSVIGSLTLPYGEKLEIDRFLLRPLYLTVLGYMMAYWGGYEIRTKSRLGLLRQIGFLSNPRFGVDRTIGMSIELLRKFYNADSCLLMMPENETRSYFIRRAERNNAKTALQSDSLNPQLTDTLLSIPENCAAIYKKRKFSLWGDEARLYLSHPELKKSPAADKSILAGIAEKFDAGSFLTVPVYYRKNIAGRVFVFTKETDVFDQTDIDFLLQAINQFMPIIENIRLVDQLASSAAEEERKKIARDIHDSIIQPYIGLQLGIDSIVQMLNEEENGNIKEFRQKEIFITRIHRLRHLTEKGIEDLRGYIYGLSHSGGSQSTLVPSIRRYAEKFTDATGIEVEIKAEEPLQITDRLAAQLFQIVAEGLSNLRRHTHSHTAFIEITADEEKIVLAIANNNDDNVVANFTPRSISERVESLGGFLEVIVEENKTVVRVEIPL